MNILPSTIRRLYHHYYRSILITLALITTLSWALALAQPRRLVEGVYTLNLAGCSLNYHDEGVAYV